MYLRVLSDLEAPETKEGKGHLNMPTEAKQAAVADLADRISKATIAIATDFSGLNVNQITELRKQ